MDNEHFQLRQDELDEEIKKTWGEDSFLDGITNFEKYQRAKVKILWILKEVNNRDGRHHNRREYHEKYATQKTYLNMMLVCHAILHSLPEYDKNILTITKDETLIEGKGLEDGVVLDHIAIINVNKGQDGKSSTPSGKLQNMYINNPQIKTFLLKQIDFINPQIIINTHDCDALSKDLIGKDKFKKIYDCNYEINNNRLILQYWHPGIPMDEEEYCSALIKTVNDMLPTIKS
jgi:hypothetical protein